MCWHTTIDLFMIRTVEDNARTYVHSMQNTLLHPILHQLSLAQSRESHRLLNLRDRFPRIQPLRTGPRAIQNSVAPIQTHRIIQRRFPLLLSLIPRIR